jgi:chromosome segregation ATPase
MLVVKCQLLLTLAKKMASATGTKSYTADCQAAKQKHEAAVAAVQAAQSAIDSETELRKTDAAAAAKLLAKDSHAVEAAQDLVDTAQSERDDAQGGLDQSKVLVQSVKELGEAITTEQQKIAASSTAAKAEESGALDGQSSIGASIEQVDAAHASGVEAHSQSEQMQHRVAQAVAEQAGAIKRAESDLEVQTEKHTEIVAQIDAHNEKLGEAKVVLKKATKALDMKKIEAESAAAEQQSAKMTFASAKAAAEDKMRAASSLLVEKAEKETELTEELNPVHEQATDRVVKSGEALEQSQIQLTAMEKEVAAARNLGTVSTNIRNIVEKMKETMIPTSFSTLDAAPTLLSNREAK